jgi:hypothetical protein
LDKPLPHDMLTSMIIKNSFRDVNYIETGEADRTMTDVEICANLREGILGGTLKVSFFREILFYNFNHRNLTKCFLFFFFIFSNIVCEYAFINYLLYFTQSRCEKEDARRN